MIEYLSSQWIDACDQALRQAGSAPIEQPVSVGQKITDGGTEAASYTIALGPNCSAAVGVDTADVIFEQDLALARSIAKGDATAHEAFMLGELKVSGDPRALIASSAATSWLHEVLAPVRSQTSW